MISNKTMKRTSEPKVKYGILKIDRRRLKGLPRTIPEIEAWIIKLGGHKTTRAEKARLKRFGLWGMPKE
jgi:hypothetical protein